MSDTLLSPQTSQDAAQSFGQWRRTVAVAFLAQGFAGVAQKSLASLEGEYRLYFLCATYVVAAVLSYILYRQRKARVTLRGIVLGTLAGTTCVLSVYFLLAALKHTGGVVVFSVVPAAALTLTLLAGRIVFKERLSRQQTLGMILAVVGIVVVQL